MKVLKWALHYPDGDVILLRKESDLERYDFSKITAIETTTIMSVEEVRKTWPEMKLPS